MTLLDNFVHTYNNAAYQYTTLIRHQGVLIGFAMDKASRIYYAVLQLVDSEAGKESAGGANQSGANSAGGAPGKNPQGKREKGPLDVEYWPAKPELLPYPREIAQVGYAVLDQTDIAAIEEKIQQQHVNGNAQSNAEKDAFLKTTARLTANAPFQVISDGEDLYLFRQAIAADHPNNVKAIGSEHAIVDRTLLCDRYVLLGKQLALKQEVRYQRSRSRTRPQSDTDSLSNVDMDGNPFTEPTQELPFINNLIEGRFSLLLLPTEVANQKRWQIFAYNNRDKTLDCFNLAQAANGLFDLVPEAAPPTYNPPTEYALRFDGTGFVNLQPAAPEGWTIDFARGFSLEAWVYYDRMQHWSRIIDFSNGISRDNIVLANVGTSTRLHFGVYFGDPLTWQGVECEGFFETGRWTHVAVTMDAEGHVTVYKDGQPQPVAHSWQPEQFASRQQLIVPPPIARTQNYLGKSAWPTDDLLMGSLDEVRLWSVARSAPEIQRDRLQRLRGDEAGLMACWRCNEGTGTQIYDATDSRIHGTFEGGMGWLPATTTRSHISQQTPVTVDQLGVQPDTKLRLSDRTLTAGMSAALYYQQEAATTGYDQEKKPLKQSARVMLATSSRESGGDRSRVTLLDFGVSRRGRLAQISPDLRLNPLPLEGSSPNQSVGALPAEIADLRSKIATRKAQLQQMNAAFDQIANPGVLFFRDRLFQGAPFQNPRVHPVRQPFAQVLLLEELKQGKEGSVRIPDGFVVNVYGTRYNPPLRIEPFTLTLTQDTPVLIEAFRDRPTSLIINRIEVRIEPQKLQAFSQLNSQQITDEQTLQSRLADLEAQAKTNSNLMPLITVDSEGLTVSGGIANFAWTDTTPQLFDSATGQLTLYFRGSDGQFFSAYYQTLTARAEFSLTAKGDANASIVVVCTARAADANMDQMQLNLQTQGDRCTFEINGPNGIREVWRDLPRDPRAFAATLMGQVTQPVYLGKLKEPIAPRSTVSALLLEECRMETLSPYGLLQVGGVEMGLTVPTEVSVTLVEIEPIRTQKTFNRGTPVYLVEENDLVLLGSLVDDVIASQSTPKLRITSSQAARSLPADATLRFSTNDDQTATVVTAVEVGLSSLAIDSTLFPNFVAAGSQVYYLPYNYARFAETNASGVDLSAGSRLLLARDVAMGGINLMSGTIVNPGMLETPEQERDRRWVSAVKSNPGQRTPSCCWVAANTGGAVSLNGKDSYLQLKDPDKLKQLSLPPSFTLETWINPRNSTNAQVLSYVADGRNSRDGDSCTYQLSTLAEVANSAYRFRVDPRNPVLTSFLAMQFAPGDIRQGFTIEAWVRFEEFGMIFLAKGAFGPPPPIPLNIRFLALDPKSYGQNRGDSQTADLYFGWEDYTQTPATVEVVARGAVEKNTWMHLAASVDASWRVQLYRDSKPLLAQPAQLRPLPNFSSNFIWRGASASCDGLLNVSVGSQLLSGRLLQMVGSVDDIRFWRKGRSQREISSDYSRRLLGNETGLAHYWYASDEDIKTSRISDRTITNQKGYFGQIVGGPFEVIPSRFTPKYSVCFRANDRALKSIVSFFPNQWTHLAATFEQAYGVQFDGTSDFLNGGNDTSLDIQQDLTIEIFVLIQQLAQGCGLICKGDFSGNNTEEETYDPTYALSVMPTGQLEFSFKDGETGQPYTFASSPATPVREGNFYRIGVTRHCVADVLTNAQTGAATVNEYTEIKFYIDEQLRGTHRIPNQRVQAGRNNQPLSIGKVDADGNQTFFCNGVISQVRLWNTARSATEITRSVNGGGLVSWWKFNEGEDSDRVNDARGSNHAKLSQNCRWVKTPDPKASPIRLYANGQLLPVQEIQMDRPQNNQFILGAALGANGAGQFLDGVIEETRLWRTVRSPEQILDNVFRQLIGEQDDLLAYYPYGLLEDEILDDSGNGLSLEIVGDPKAVRQPSDAPISLDAPQVRNAIGGPRTAFNAVIDSAPGVHEYADMQYDADGDMIGVFKRCYSYIQGNEWKLITGFKVGDLTTEWIGQVQFAPQIIGFIEGAPPVPSENLTVAENYSEASSVELQSADSTIYTYDSNFAGYALGSLDAKLQQGIDFEVGTVKGGGVAVFAGIDTKLAKVRALAGIRVTGDTEIGGSQAYTQSKVKRVSQLSKMTLQGTRENDNTIRYPELDRRFIPKNVGFALVQSETADVFALRLKHKDPARRVLIAYQVMPNPDIPKDWNIINFPMNPRYTKQGTLDGKVGLNPDVSYPNATGYSSDRSYFKPREAYALKNEIDKQDQWLKSLYNSSRTVNMDRVSWGKSNLVNTYVWTADGGLFTESSDTLEIYKENFSTSASFKFMAGFVASADVGIVATAVTAELTAMAGFQIRYSEAKTLESQKSFNIHVDVNPERDIYQRDLENPDRIVYDRSGEPKKQPGKVDAYRFMTFYLEPSQQNFQRFYNSVVDPVWLAQSNDPSAIALREARTVSKEPPCWRIFHRVTYVSRVLPEIPSPSAPLTELEQTLTSIPDINSNYELIRKLDPFVRNHKDSVGALAQAIHEVLSTSMPALLIHQKDIVQFMINFYGLS